MARKAATVRMPTCAQTANKASPAGDPAEAGFTPPAEAGFTLVEMLVAMLILSLVGLTLARFQTFQMHSTASLAMGAAGKLAADNLAIDLLVAPAAPTTAQSGVAEVGGRPWYWQVTPAPPPDPALMPDLVRLDITVSAEEGGAAIATRSLLRPRGNPPVVTQR